jgi:acyl-homoserine-lactone acylase
MSKRLVFLKFLKVFLFCCFVLLFCFSCGDNKKEQTEILWDSWGVPHIFAQETKDLFYAFGWAQMKSHGDLILSLYGRARGKAAEYWGESYLESDKAVLTSGFPALSRIWQEKQDPTFKLYLDAFVEGMNAYADSHGDKLDESKKQVLPIKGEDVTAHTIKVLHGSFVGGAALWQAKRWEQSGSNAWAVGPSRSTSGNSLLLANPHLGWSDDSLFYEAQLTGPEAGVYGATLIGFPVLAIAFNNNLGWTHTVNPFDGMDLYELTLAEEGYLYDGQVNQFQKESYIINVKQKDGTFREEHLTVKRSVHGPILAEKKDKAVAVRIVGLDQPNVGKQWWEMGKASNLEEFEEALKQLQIPMFNVVYADKDGHIMYLFNGRVPKKTKGDWNFWRGIVPGDKSEFLWTEVHPYQDLPRIVDPENGWVQNCNDSPWSAVLPWSLDPANYPTYMSSPRYISLRPARSIRMLSEDDQITFEELIQYKHSTRMELADRILDDLIPAAKEYGNDLTKKAADVLEKWDRNTDATSQGAVLFALWTGEITGLNIFADPWNADDPLNTPDGLADPKKAVEMLGVASKKCLETYGALNVPWGNVHRLIYKDIDLPANGGSGGFGIFRCVYFDHENENRFQAVSGDSYVAVVEFSNPIRAQVLLSYGNASQPDSPHCFDQLELFSRKELRPVWRTKEQINAHLELREVFER